MKIKKTYQVPDMHCSSCVMRLEALEDRLPGILSIQASYHRQTLQVEYDDKLLSETRLVEEVRRLGYTIDEGKL